jgi:hypothetical protein
VEGTQARSGDGGVKSASRPLGPSQLAWLWLRRSPQTEPGHPWGSRGPPGPSGRKSGRDPGPSGRVTQATCRPAWPWREREGWGHLVSGRAHSIQIAQLFVECFCGVGNQSQARCHGVTPIPGVPGFFSFWFFILVGLRFELRVSHLQTKGSTA